MAALGGTTVGLVLVSAIAFLPAPEQRERLFL